MQSKLRNAPGGTGLSSTHKVRTGGGAPGGASGGTSPQKGGRRSGASSATAAGAAAAAADAQTDAQQSAQASSIKEGGVGAGAAQVTSSSSSSSSPSKGGKNQSSSRPSSREKAPVGSQMTAAERIAAELSREEGIILVTCSACRVIKSSLLYGSHSMLRASFIFSPLLMRLLTAPTFCYRCNSPRNATKSTEPVA